MPALVNELQWPTIAAAAGATGMSGRRRAARLAGHLLGWPLLVKAGLLGGVGLAWAVRHLLGA
ncbi:MAG TPA: hypothetical protein VF548_05875 [Allosphingosinicella sp.]|jgi:hypothetical protein